MIMNEGEISDWPRSPGFRESDLELMQEMFRNAPVSICLLEGPEHRLAYVNESFRHLFGNIVFPRGTTSRAMMSELRQGEEVIRSRLDMLNRIYHTNELFIRKEYKVYLDRKNTGIFEEAYFNVVYQPLKDPDGDVYGLLLMGFEVTELVRARQEMVRHEQRLTLALQGARMGFWEVDNLNHTLDYISDQTKMHFGHSADQELTYEQLIASIHPDDRNQLRDKANKALEDSDGYYEIEYRVTWPDGSQHWLMSRGQYLQDDQGRLLRHIGVTMDLTRHKQIEQKLREAIRLRDDFLSIAAHELKTPVAGMKTRTELFERHLKDAGEDGFAEQARIINECIDQLSRLTGNLLDISRLRKMGLKLDRQTISLNELIAEKVDMLQSVSHHDIEVQGEVQQQIYVDGYRIGQVLTNLLENAVKYSPRADRVIVRVSHEQDEVCVSVVDFGIGISNREKPKVFERFFKGQDSKKETYPGFGIGLYISRQIVERHGGDIWVEDNPEGGSVFTFTLPVTEHENEPID